MKFSVQESSAGKKVCCPSCDNAIRVTGEAGQSSSAIKEQATPPPLPRDDDDDDFRRRKRKKSPSKPSHFEDVGKMVRSLENRAAREEEDRKPIGRDSPIMKLIIGIMLVLGGLLLMVLSLSGGGGDGSLIPTLAKFAFGVLVPLIMIITGAIFLIGSRN
jgi:hypothetical protein